MKRPLFLHHSALSPDEFGPLTLWLQELCPPATESASIFPATLEADVRVDDVGRFLLERLRVPEEVWEEVLSYFRPSHTSIQPRFATSQSHLRPLPPLSGGNVLMLLRLVVHASTGRDMRSEGLELAFRQAIVPADLLTQSPSSTLFAPYLAQRHAKPPPPPLHVHRLPRREVGASRVTSSDSPPPMRRESPLPMPPPPSRMSTAGVAPAQDIVPENVQRMTESWPQAQGLTISDSEYLQKVADAEPSSSDDDLSSDSEEDVQESVERSQWYPTTMTVDDHAERIKIANRSVATSRPPAPTSSGTSSNPFRSRLQSVPSSAVIAPLGSDLFRTFSAGQDRASPKINPVLPPRPSFDAPSPAAGFKRRTPPPLPPRSDQSYTQSSSSSLSGGRAGPEASALSARKAPLPARPSKPAGLLTGRVSSAFKTSELVHRSLAAAEEARREAESAPDKTRRIEVIGSSPAVTKEHGPRVAARSIKAQHSGGRESVMSVGSNSKWNTVNTTLGRGKPQFDTQSQIPAVGSQAFDRSMSRATDNITAITSLPAMSDPANTEQSSSRPDGPTLPPPPVRRNSSLSKPTMPGPKPTYGGYVVRHTSLSYRPSPSANDSVLGDLRSSFDNSLRAFGHAAEDLRQQARRGLPPVDTATTTDWGNRSGAGDRERLMDKTDQGKASSGGERNSTDGSRETLRRSLDRPEGGYRPLK